MPLNEKSGGALITNIKLKINMLAKRKSCKTQYILEVKKYFYVELSCYALRRFCTKVTRVKLRLSLGSKITLRVQIYYTLNFTAVTNFVSDHLNVYRPADFEAVSLISDSCLTAFDSCQFHLICVSRLNVYDRHATKLTALNISFERISRYLTLTKSLQD